MPKRRNLDFTLAGCGVYRITNRKTGRFYIGSTSSFARRWQEHQEQLNTGIHPNFRLQADWRIFGPDAFVFSIIERCDPQDRLDREQYYIDTMRATVAGYNINPFTRPPIPADATARGMLQKHARKQLKTLRRR
jgi:group I intron endonuclease